MSNIRHETDNQTMYFQTITHTGSMAVLTHECRLVNCSVNFPTIYCESVHLLSCLTLLVGRQEEHPARKNWVMRCQHGHLSGARCKWFAHSPPDATATLSSLASLKSRLVSPFWCRLTQVVLEERPLHGCLSVCLVHSLRPDWSLLYYCFLLLS